MKKFDIFISYRRDGGFQVADSVYQRLVAANYSVFLDMEQLNSGEFNTKLYDVIENCKDVILILPPNALDRCSDEKDWVRKEIEYAIKLKKNIVPIMLRGYEWPDEESLPESLRTLRNYNGITATDHNVYIENIERLKKKFLTSRPMSWWKRYKRYLFVVMFVLVAALAVGVVMKCADDKATEQTVPAEYEAVCKDFASRIMGEYIKMDCNFTTIKHVYEDWNSFLDDCASAKFDREQMVEDFHALINMSREGLMAPGNVMLSEEDRSILRAYYPAFEDFIVVQEMVNMFYDEINGYYNSLVEYSGDEYPTKHRELMRLNLESIQLSLEMNYLYILALCADMPKSVEPLIMELTGCLSNPVNVVIGQEKAAYEKMLDISTNKYEEIIRSMGDHVIEYGRKVSVLDEINNQIEVAYKIMYEWVAIYSDAVEQEIVETDDISSAWSKITKMATVTRMVDEHADIISELLHIYADEAAKARIESSIVPDEIFDLEKFNAEYVDVGYMMVYVLLSQYEAMNPNNDRYIADYVKAARIYYAGVDAGTVSADTGLLVFATSDDMEHPTVRVGDIITEVDGKPVATYETYAEAYGDGSKNSSVKLLRVNDKGYMDVVSGTLPANCQVTIGCLPLYMKL